MNRNKLLLFGGVGAVAVFGLGWYLTSAHGSSSSSSAPQNAVNPNAQVGAGAYAQGTAPDYGNLLSYNTIPGVMSAPQATSVSGIFNYMDPSTWSAIGQGGTPMTAGWLGLPSGALPGDKNNSGVDLNNLTMVTN